MSWLSLKGSSTTRTNSRQFEKGPADPTATQTNPSPHTTTCHPTANCHAHCQATMPHGNSQLRLIGAASHGYNTRSVRYPPIQSQLGNVALGQQMSVMAQAVQHIILASRSDNTAVAYDPKANEWDQFCNYTCSNEALNTCYTVTSDKIFSFLAYQAFRSQRKSSPFDRP